MYHMVQTPAADQPQISAERPAAAPAECWTVPWVGLLAPLAVGPLP